jgi:hypothetical protein
MTGTFLIRVGGYPDERGKINALLTTCARDYESTRKNRPWQNAKSGFSKYKSENQLERKLNQTFRRSDAALHRTRYSTEPVTRGSAVEAGSRGRKIWVVEQIEELSAELETDPLGNRCPLEDSEIKVPDSGSSEC